LKRQRMNYTAREKAAILRRTALRKSGLNTARAWALKEPAMALGTRPIGTVIGHRIMTPLRPAIARRAAGYSSSIAVLFAERAAK
jgi:hypothetical protein